MSDMTWTPKLVEAFTAAYADGASHSDLAARFGVTRNASIGKAHRLNLPSRVGGRPQHPAPAPMKPKTANASLTRNIRRKLARLARPPLVPVASRQEPPLPPHGAPVTLMQLALMTDMPGTCRWPLYEPAGPATMFCGAGRGDITDPYCAHHSRLAAGHGTPSERRASRPAEVGVR